MSEHTKIGESMGLSENIRVPGSPATGETADDPWQDVPCYAVWAEPTSNGDEITGAECHVEPRTDVFGTWMLVDDVQRARQAVDAQHRTALAELKAIEAVVRREFCPKENSESADAEYYAPSPVPAYITQNEDGDEIIEAETLAEVVEAVAGLLTRAEDRNGKYAAQLAERDRRITALEGQCWQPIATAPKDRAGVFIVLTNPRWAYPPAVVGRWIHHHAGGWWEAVGKQIEPTHWMPLPVPPVTGDSQ